MINSKELLEDFLALGYDDDTAVQLAKQELERRNRAVRENQRQMKLKQDAKLRFSSNKPTLLPA